jgi:hypothetical protein
MDNCATKEEVNLQMQVLREEVHKMVFESHVGIDKTISNLGADTLDRLEKILEQTTKTNGRVTSLETWKAVHTSETGTMQTSISDVKTTLSRLNWLLITAVFMAVLNLILK